MKPHREMVAGVFILTLVLLAGVAAASIVGGGGRPGDSLPEDGSRRRVATIHRPLPSLENESVLPSIVIATVTAKEPRRRLRDQGGFTIFTPVRLNVERVLADEIGAPVDTEYYLWGGTTEDGSAEIIAGIHADVRPGERYLISSEPLKLGGEYDPGTMGISWAMPIDAAGTVLELTSWEGTTRRVPLTDAIQFVMQRAREAPWYGAK